MARKNKLGTSFCSLGFDPGGEEEKAMKAYLKEKGWSAKRWLRSLVRTELQTLKRLK